MCVRPAAWAWATMRAGSPPSAYCGCQIHIPLPVGNHSAGGAGGGGAVVVVGATVVVVGATVVDVVVGTSVVVVVVVVLVVTWGNTMWFRNIDARLGAP